MLRALLLVTALLAGCASQHAATPYPPPNAAGAIPGALDAALAEAAAQDKLAMLVLGANWCHDSTHFAAMINEPALRSWLQQHYVITLFNLGYMDDVRSYLEPFAVPAVYGTPTVLIVEPDTRRVRNLSTHYYWRNASQLDATAARDYFGDYLAVPPQPAPVSGNLAAALGRIDRFEAAQAERVLDAYGQLAPMMQAYEEGNPPSDFDEKWYDLAKMRGQLTTDLDALRQSARDQDAAGRAPIELDFPSYSLFTD